MIKESRKTVPAARGDFARLRRTIINKRTLIYRDSVEELKAELDRRSYVVAEGGLVKRRK